MDLSYDKFVLPGNYLDLRESRKIVGSFGDIAERVFNFLGSYRMQYGDDYKSSQPIELKLQGHDGAFRSHSLDRLSSIILDRVSSPRSAPFNRGFSSGTLIESGEY